MSRLKDNNICITSLNITDLIFGKFEMVDFLLITQILLIGKYYHYSRKCNGSLPSLGGFIARTRRVHGNELHIVRKRGKVLTLHLRKWEKLMKSLTN